MLNIRKLTPAIGAEIAGVDLSGPLSPQVCDQIYDALMQHQVVFFRDQHISPENHMALAGSFGDPEPPHPVYPHVDGFESVMKLENHPDNPPDTDGWHTDLTFRQQPPFASILWASKVPECGGDTLWMNLYAAYDALPAGIKRDLEGMTAVHDMGDFRNNFAVGEDDGARLTAAHQRFGSAIHPVVRTHPVTGRRFLFVNDGFTVHLNGLKAGDSRALLNYLLTHMNQPEFQLRFTWRDHSLAIWDNRCTMHYAVADYLPHYRCMHRVTVVNDRRVEKAVRAA